MPPSVAGCKKTYLDGGFELSCEGVRELGHELADVGPEGLIQADHGFLHIG
jgi:hypothetical protein